MTLDTLIEQIKSLSDITGGLQEYIVVTDTNGIIRYHSPQFAELVGAKDNENITGKHVFRDFPFEANDFPFESPSQKTTLLEHALKTQETAVSSRVRYGDKGKDEKYINIKISPMPEHGAAVVSFVDVTRDVMAAIVDGLTGAYSQTYYRTGLKERTIAEAERTKNKYLGIVGIDLKGLKNVNDERSHAAGDVVLKDLVEILKSAVRKTDYVVRDGGDEFLILCPGADEGVIGRIMHRIYGRTNAYNAKVSDPLLKINPYIVGIAGNSDYEDLFAGVEERINAQKRLSK